jgi:ribonuclease R
LKFQKSRSINEWFVRSYFSINVLHNEAHIIETKDDTIPVETSITGVYQVSPEIVTAPLKLDELAKILSRRKE